MTTRSSRAGPAATRSESVPPALQPQPMAQPPAEAARRKSALRAALGRRTGIGPARPGLARPGPARLRRAAGMKSVDAPASAAVGSMHYGEDGARAQA